MDLLPFQRRFVTAALKPGIRTAVLSLPRGNGKSTLAAWLMARCLTPGDELHRPGAEYHLCAASIGQVRRTTWRLLRELPTDNVDYKWAESRSEVGVLHRPTGTRCTVLASKREDDAQGRYAARASSPTNRARGRWSAGRPCGTPSWRRRGSRAATCG